MITLEQLRSMSPEQRLAAFVDWVGTKPRDETYNYHETANCALCQFGRFVTGFKRGEVIACNDAFTALGPKTEHVKVVQCSTDFDSNTSVRLWPSYHISNSKTFGELYDRLLPLVTPQHKEMSEAELEAVELRALVGIPVRTLDYEGGA